jgi:hypothetical protein
MAYQAKSYGRLYHTLSHLVLLYKRAKKDVGKNQAFKPKMNGHSLNGRLGGVGLLSSFRLSPLTHLLHCGIFHVLNIFSRWKGNL